VFSRLSLYWGLPTLVAVFIWFLFCVIGIFSLYLARHKNQFHQLQMGQSCIFLLNPLVWPYWNVLLAPSVVSLLSKVDQSKSSSQRLIIQTSLIAFGVTSFFQNTAWSKGFGLFLCGLFCACASEIGSTTKQGE
jgi:hypothetical protein